KRGDEAGRHDFLLAGPDRYHYGVRTSIPAPTGLVLLPGRLLSPAGHVFVCLSALQRRTELGLVVPRPGKEPPEAYHQSDRPEPRPPDGRFLPDCLWHSIIYRHVLRLATVALRSGSGSRDFGECVCQSARARGSPPVRGPHLLRRLARFSKDR